MTENQEYPAPPPVCVVCAATDGLEPVTVKKVFIPPWVWLFLLLGVLPAALISLAVQTKHAFSFRYCPLCIRKRNWAAVVHWLAMLSCITLLFVAIGAGVSMHSWLVFFSVIAVTVGIAIASSKFDASANPRYSVFSANRVEIEIPNHGRFVVFPPYYLLPSSQQT
jgi:Disulfide bond formation protein DsbB